MSKDWLEPFKKAEAERHQQPKRQKFGGPTAAEMGVELGKNNSNDPRSCYGCVFYRERGNNCDAGIYTQNKDVHNGCATIGKVWVRSKTVKSLDTP